MAGHSIKILVIQGVDNRKYNVPKHRYDCRTVYQCWHQRVERPKIQLWGSYNGGLVAQPPMGSKGRAMP